MPVLMSVWPQYQPVRRRTLRVEGALAALEVEQELLAPHAAAVAAHAAVGIHDAVAWDHDRDRVHPVRAADRARCARAAELRELTDELSLRLLERTEAHSRAPIQVYRPQHEAVIEFVRNNGEKAMYESIDLRKACCGIRKLEPLGRMLAERSAWITGLRREQSNNRGDMAARELDDKGRTKFNPLIEWTWGDVWHYVSVNHVPYNPLHDQFMPSIGCAPCTRAIAVGEDFRAGRWWWEDEKAKECGLHVKQHGDA